MLFRSGETVTIDASEANGGFTLGGSGINTAGGIFYGGNGADSLVIAGIAGDYDMSMGKGADTLLVETGWGTQDRVAMIDVDLGADDAADTIALWGQKGSGNHSKGGAYIKVSNFVAANDKLGTFDIPVDDASTLGGAYVEWGAIASNASKITGFLNAFLGDDAMITAAALQTEGLYTSDGKFLTTGTGANAKTYLAFITNDGGSGQALDSSATVNGCALVELVGVALNSTANSGCVTGNIDA